ncbi:MAG: SRPBCC family protein [Acidimicrobiia bacterium]
MSEKVLSYQIYIDAPRTQVWDVIADFGNVANLSPGIKKSYLTSDITRGVGATRHCDLALYGSTVDERIVEWTEGESFRIDIYESSRLPLIKTSGGSFHVADHDGGTLLTGTLHYSLKYGPIGSLVEKLALRKQLAREWKIFLAGTKKHIETGTLIDRDTRVPVDAVNAGAKA